MIFPLQTIDPNFTTRLSNSTGKFPEIWKEAPTLDKFAMQEFRTLIIEHFDSRYEDVIEDLIHKFEHQLGYEEYKQKR